MDCSMKAILGILILHVLIGAILPMEDYYLLESSDFPMPDSTSIEVESSTVMVTPTSASEAPPPILETSMWVPTINPTPEPVPPDEDKPFFNYLNRTLFLFIQKLRIEYKNDEAYTVSSYELLPFQLTTVMPTDTSLIATYNNSRGEKEFEITFFFDKSSSGPNGEEEWHLDTFQHQNFSETDKPIYQYSGTTFGIKTLMGHGFNCSTIEFIGSAKGDGYQHYARTKFTDISLQPFLINRQVSSDFNSCDSGFDRNDRLPIEVIVGVTVAVCVCVGALIIMVLAVFIKKYQKRRNYDILSD